MRAFRAPSRPAETTHKDHNRQPTKAISGDAQDAPSRASQHISKMAKGTNSNLASSHEHMSNSTHISTGASRRAPVTSQAGPNRNEDTTPTIHPRTNALSSPQYSQPRTVNPATSLSTIGTQKSNVLRRKASTIEQYAASKRAQVPKFDSRNAPPPEDEDKASDLENTSMKLPRPEEGRAAALHRVDSKAPDSAQTSHLDLPETRGFTPPVAYYAQSVTPSTRYTDSPFSHVPTPSSASSYSSGMIAPSHSAPIRQRQQSPVLGPPLASRPTTDKNDYTRLGLPPARESSTSSSNSTIKSSEPRSALSRKKAPQTTIPPSVSRKPVPTASQPSSKSKPQSKQPPAKAPIGIPPELAHLNVDPPAVTSTNRSPPRRPSRDGTTALTGMKIGSPVVQSDLPRLYTSYHKRTPSQETPTSASSPSLKSRFGFSSKQSSPRIDSAISPPPAARALTRAPSSDQLPTNQPRLIRKDSPAIGPTPSKSPRFGFWSRKPKADETKPIEKPSRPPSKGPAAGTGHEGYGRFSTRGRSSSGSSSAGLRSPSTTSTTSSQAKRKSSRNSSMASTDGLEMDDFLRERLTPVVLRGSASTVSNATSTSDGPALSKASSLDSISRPQLLPSAMDNTAGRSPSKRSPQKRAPFSDSEDDLTARFVSTTEKRHAGQTLQPAAVPNKSSRDNLGDRAIPQTVSNWKGRVANHEDSGDGSGKGPRKWSFFQRTQASPREKGKAKAPSVPDLSSHLVHQPSVPHYAMLDPATSIGLEEVEQIVRDNETSPEDSTSETNASVRSIPYGLSSLRKAEYSSDAHFHARPHPPRITIRNDSADSSKVRYAGSMIPHQAPHMIDIRRSPDGWSEQKAMAIDLKPVPSIASSAVHTPDTPQEGFDSPDPDNANSPRQPRLSPIGRIPKVVSKRDRERKLSDSSFSRPFVRTQPKPSVKPPGSLYNQIRELASPTESTSQPLSSTSTTSNGASTEKRSSFNASNLRSEPTGRASVDAFGKSEFFASPRRKDSDVSYSSSSGNASVLAILAAQPPQQEDIWDEYDDLMDEVTLGEGASFSSFQYSDTFWSSPVSQEWHQQSAAMDLARSQTVPATLSVPQQIARFMQPSFSPLTTPQVLSEFFENYGRRSTSTMNGGESIRSSILKPLPLEPRTANLDKASETNRSMLPRSNRSSLPRSNRSSLPSARGSIASSKRTSTHSRSASLPENPGRHSQSSLTPSGRLNRDTQLLDIVEVDGDEESATANLRYAALTTSKWLSFGRVLFSPAHHEMRPADDPRILIIDGLGSDWSYYVAATYPTAVVYNLGPPAPPSFTDWPGVLNEPPPLNHRHISHSSISAAFPFPKGFFTAVVFRFPLATSDTAYQACIFECKRVLRPGGFLEVAALDLDLMNMGNLARKELRGLKTRLQSRDRDIGLRNLSDMLVRLIGRRGFEDLQRCIVGVPVAGQIRKSQDISSVGSAEGAKTKRGDDRPSLEVELADLFEDARAQQPYSGASQSKLHDKTTDNDDTEDNTIKMVAKVGRWWYSTCYERPHLLRTDDSIWNDTALLRECEKQGTSFRLLICYAQKPAQTKRRTVSV